MVVQYKDTLKVTITTPGGEDENGYPLPPSEVVKELKCRAEVNSRNAVVYLGDGTAFVYSYLIQIKKGQIDVPLNTDVTLVLSQGEVSGKAMFYKRDQLHSRLWI